MALTPSGLQNGRGEVLERVAYHACMESRAPLGYSLVWIFTTLLLFILLVF
ncbi:hypothetical protein DFQ01_1347 [Paenibacillus cellulosilyticus]|uniref:Uncharacterized protein n=1 Tax=Paenibacillus cellulosilyticus TaxID=375489 RepID=A0A2V2YKU7_9BACL|nr:hypothetical protein DFQ01_1347 [Paenibacillus cellulosilyticus]